MLCDAEHIGSLLAAGGVPVGTWAPKGDLERGEGRQLPPRSPGGVALGAGFDLTDDLAESWARAGETRESTYVDCRARTPAGGVSDLRESTYVDCRS